MAWATGTANGHIDLMDKLVSFLSTNPELVAAGEKWEILRNAAYPFPVTWPGRVAFMQGTQYLTKAPDRPPIDMRLPSVKWKAVGKLNVPSTGQYGFALASEGTLMIRVDGVVIGGVYGGSTQINSNTFNLTFTAELTAGQHDIEILYLSLGTVGNTTGASLAWRLPGQSTFALMAGGVFSDMVVRQGQNTYTEALQAGAEAADKDKDYLLKAPGLSGSDEIYVGLRTYSNYQSDFYNVSMNYATGYAPEAYYEAQPGASGTVKSYFWNQAIKYWFVASGRRFIVIAKISTTYSSMYGGFFLPYALPSEMPYPIAIGGNGASNVRWSTQNEYVGAFWNPNAYGGGRGSLVTRDVNGNEEIYVNYSWSTGNAEYQGKTYPYAENTNPSANVIGQLSYRPSPDNQYAIQPIVLSSGKTSNVYGELDGVFHISGFGNASENVITIDGQDYLVVQSGFRSTASDYAAIRLK